MAFSRQWLLISVALVLSGGPLLAVTHEQRDFTAAAAAFQDSMWSRAEVELAQYIEKYPDSPTIPQAVLMQAQADYNQGKLLETIKLLQNRQSSAGALADQYTYWIGQAQYQNGDYDDAASTFAKLASAFPNSKWRLDAVVNQADANAKLGQWDQVTALLQKSGGIFQEAARTNADDTRVLNGHLLLAQALLAQNHPDQASAVLQSSAFKHNPELDWQRLSMLVRSQCAAGHTNEALDLTTNLIQTASRANRADLRAQSIAQQAGILEKIGRLSDAQSIYSENLKTSSPNEWQRQAVLKVAELSAAQTNFLDAENSLEDFQSRFPNSPAQDSVLLALGELHLKSFESQPSATNSDLSQAHLYFDQFIGTFTNSPLLGKAYLDRGWSFWLQEKWPESAADFQSASDELPMSEDLAVARFKLGDAAFQLNDLTNALQNYQSVVNDFTNYPAVSETLGAQALYQTVRVCIKMHDFLAASNAMAQTLKIYPSSTLSEQSILLAGEELSDLGQPVKARALFEKFKEVFPNSDQIPKVDMAIARTYQQENNWPMAISTYNSWVGRYPENTNMPEVKYARAWANFEAGNETNAFLQFTNFIAEFPTNQYAPIAQWWLGDYYFGQSDWQDAERNYKLVFQNWPSHELAYPAMLRAGHAALDRTDFEGAKNYFEQLTTDTNCPPQYDAQALFSLGCVFMQEPDTNNPLTNFVQAKLYFQAVCQTYPNSEQAALAWGEIGDCNLQLAGQNPEFYKDATNAYNQVMNSSYAGITERSQAQVGIGIVLEKRAALVSEDKNTLLQSALDNYLDVFFGNNLRTGEASDPVWVKQAGYQALPLIETLGTGDPDKFINQMETVLPELKDSLEKRRLELPRAKTQ